MNNCPICNLRTCKRPDEKPVWDASAPLVMTPNPVFAKREWVWLTDEDVEQAKDDARRSFRRHYYSARGQIVMPQYNYEWHLIRAIEYKLKEKNT